MPATPGSASASPRCSPRPGGTAPSSSSGAGAPGATSPTPSARWRRRPARRRGRHPAAQPAGAHVGLLLGVLRAGGVRGHRSTPGRGDRPHPDDIAGLDLPVLAGDPADLADLVPAGAGVDDGSSAIRSSPTVVDVTGDRHTAATAARASPCGCSRAAPPARPSASTSRTRRSSGSCVGAKHYERATATPTLRLRVRRGRSSTRRWSTSAACSGCCSASTTAGRSACSSGSPSTAGSTPSAATARHGQPRARRRCAWCSRPTSTPPTSPASARWCRAPRRSTPTTPTPSPRATACRCSSRTPPPSSAAASPAGTSPTTELLGGEAGQRRPGAPGLRAAGGRPRRRASAGPDAEGLLEVKARQLGDGRVGAHHRPGPHRRRRLPLDPGPGRPGDHPRRLQGPARGRPGRARAAPRGCGARRWSGRPTRASARCRWRPSSCGPAPPVGADDLLATRRHGARPLRAPGRDPVVDALPAPGRQGRPGRGAPARPAAPEPVSGGPALLRADEAFRAEVRAGSSGCPATARRPRRATGRPAGPTTPAGSASSTTPATPACTGREFGGRGLPVTQQLVYLEEYAGPTRPTSASTSSACHAGPTLIAEGTDEQRVPPAPHPEGRERVVPGVLRARGRLRPRLAAHPAVRTATSTSSPARRSGAPGPTWPTTASCWCAPTPTRRSTRASPG